MLIENLRDEIDAYAARLMGASRLWKLAERGAVTPRIVAEYIYNLFHLVSASQAHLELASSRARELGRHDLSGFFSEKSAEEAGHQLWAVDDLAALRATFGAESTGEVKPAMQRLIGAIERAIQKNPAGHLGYATFAEYFTVIAGPGWLRILSERCGIPSSLLSVVSRHVELDGEHAARGFTELARMIQDSDAEAVVGIVRTAMACLEDFYDELADEGPASPERVDCLTHAA